MENPETEKENIIKDARNPFEEFFQNEEENYYKPVRASNFWINNYIEYKSNSDRNKTPLVEECFNNNFIQRHYRHYRPYLKDIIDNLIKSETWKIQVAIAIAFISSIANVMKSM